MSLKRLTDRKRRAMVALFLTGWSMREIGLLFQVPMLTVADVVRQSSGGARW